MTAKEYLENVLEDQKLSQDSQELQDLKTKRDEVEELLRTEFKDSDPTIRYGGSKAKGTMIKDSYDLDVICYFENDDDKAGETLKDIYNNVHKVLQKEYLVEPKTSSLRLKSSNPSTLGVDCNIDVVPGRFTDDKKEDAFLYYAKAEKERQKTNLQKHIDHVKNSGLKDIIKLMKLWKFRRDISVRTFILELLTIEILNDFDGTIDEKLVHLWQEMRDNINDYTIEDPANSNNDLSDMFDDYIKTSLSNASRSTLFDIDTYGWETVFGEATSKSKSERIKVIEKIAAGIANPVRPWSRKD